MYSVYKEFLENIFTDVALVADEFVEDLLHETLVLERSPVIHIPWGDHEVQQFALLVAYKMEFETEEASHGAFAPGSKALESLMDMYPLVAADAQRGGVNKTYSCTLAQKDFLDEYGQGDYYLLLDFDKPAIRNCFGEQVLQMRADIVVVEMLQAAVTGSVEHNHDDYDFRVRHGGSTMVLASGWPGRIINGVFFHHTVKNFAKLVCHKENFCNFTLGEHSGGCCEFFVFEYYKDTKFSDNHQIYKHL